MSGFGASPSGRRTCRRKALTQPAVDNHRRHGTRPRLLHWRILNGCRTEGSGALPSTPATREGGERRRGTPPGGPTTEAPPRALSGERPPLTETPDREPALPIRRRSAGPTSGDGCGETLRWRSRERLEQRSPGELHGFSQSVWDADAAFRTPRRSRTLPFGPCPDCSGTGSVLPWVGAGSAPNLVRTIRLEYPSGTGDPNLPASAPDGTDLRPNLAEEVSRVRHPPAEAVGCSLRSRPSKGSRTGESSGDEPRSRFGLQALACGRGERRGQRSPAPEGGGELRRILWSPATLPEGSACLRLRSRPLDPRALGLPASVPATRAGTLAACGG
jgi:hypothetical protein